MKIFPDIRLKDSNISSVFVPLGKKEDVSRYLVRADPDYDYGDIDIGHALICLFTGFPAHPLTGGWHWVGVWNPAYDKASLSYVDE